MTINTQIVQISYLILNQIICCKSRFFLNFVKVVNSLILWLNKLSLNVPLNERGARDEGNE